MKENEKSCWFYDDQLNNRLTSITLHVNTYYSGGEWKWCKDGPYKVDAGGYNMEPICRSVLNEDFNVAIGNVWSDLGGDPISNTVNDIMHAAAPYADAISTALKELGQKAQTWGSKSQIEYDEEGKPKLSIAQTIASWTEHIGNIAEQHGDTAVDFMNSNLIMQGTRFSYFSGTGISFGNLGMRFTLFPMWKDGAFYTVNQQLEDLLPYAIGKYENLKFDLKYKTLKGAEETGHFESDLIGWQRSPAGYRAHYKDIDNKALKGTMKLRIGAFYVLESLVCENLSFNMSRQMVKKPQGVGYYGLNAGKDRIKNIDPNVETISISPLFCDVNLSLRASTKYSDTVMRNFIYGLNMAGEENEGAQKLNRQMNSDLDKIKRQIREKYLGPGIIK